MERERRRRRRGRKDRAGGEGFMHEDDIKSLFVNEHKPYT